MRVFPDEASYQAWLEAEFDRCWPWLAGVLETYPADSQEPYSKERIREGMAAGLLAFWSIGDAVALSRHTQSGTGDLYIRAILAGGPLFARYAEHLQNVLSEYARRVGAIAVIYESVAAVNLAPLEAGTSEAKTETETAMAHAKRKLSAKGYLDA
jgi:hypothetical protein